jgi:hypothetical protein
VQNDRITRRENCSEDRWCARGRKTEGKRGESQDAAKGFQTENLWREIRNQSVSNYNVACGGANLANVGAGVCGAEVRAEVELGTQEHQCQEQGCKSKEFAWAAHIKTTFRIGKKLWAVKNRAAGVSAKNNPSRLGGIVTSTEGCKQNAHSAPKTARSGKRQSHRGTDVPGAVVPRLRRQPPPPAPAGP